jgi:hypothetical protein
MNCWTSAVVTWTTIQQPVFRSLNRTDVSSWRKCNRELLPPRYRDGVPASVGLGSSRLVHTSFTRSPMLACQYQPSMLRDQRISLYSLRTLKFALIFHIEACRLSLPHHSSLNKSTINSTTDGSSPRFWTTYIVDDGGVLYAVTRVMKITRGKLIKQPDWDEWLTSEYLQLDQYDAQGMFGDPVEVDSDAAVF